MERIIYDKEDCNYSKIIPNLSFWSSLIKFEANDLELNVIRKKARA